jgi:hypothetical protein
MLHYRQFIPSIGLIQIDQLAPKVIKDNRYTGTEISKATSPYKVKIAGCSRILLVSAILTLRIDLHLGFCTKIK